MKTVTGNGIVTVGDAAPYKKELTVYGNTRQNLWTNPDTRTANGVTLTNNADGTITLAGTCTANTWIFITVFNAKANTTYTLSADKAVQNSGDGICAFYFEEYDDAGTTYSHVIQSGNKSITFTTKSSVTKANCAFIAYTGAVLSGTYRVMLNEGSTAEPWCPPGIHGVDELTLGTAGKNILQYLPSLKTSTNAGITFTPQDDGGIKVQGTATLTAYYNIDFVSSASSAISDARPFIGTQVTASMHGGAGVNFAATIFDDDGEWENLVSTASSVTATVPDDAASFRSFISVAQGISVDTVVYPQLERGTEATAYEPPNITQTTIDLQGHSLHSLPDGTRDELRVDYSGAVAIGARFGTFTANGDEDWVLSPHSSNQYRFALNNWVDDVWNVTLGPEKFYCDALPKSLDKPSDYSGNHIVINGRYQLYVCRDGITTVEALKSWLASHPVTVVYPLATEQTIELGSIEMPYMLRGLNNVMAVSDVTPEIELSYYPLAPCSDGIIVNDRHSFHDLGQCIASRNTGAPEKKAITKTVPFMSGFYDFSNLYGGIAYESREISYSFELLGDSREDLQRQKSELMEWLSYVHDTEIRDDDVPGWHFVGSFSGYSWDETADGESGTLEVTFLCQPFMEADEETSKALAIGTHTVTNDGQPVNPVVSVASGTAKITINGFVQSVTGETRLSVQLPHGDTSVKVEGAAATLKWKEARI